MLRFAKKPSRKRALKKTIRAPKPRRRLTAAAKTRIINGFVMLLVCAVCYGILLLIQEYKLMQVKVVVANGTNYYISNSEVAQILENYKGKFYLDLPKAEHMERKIKDQIPQMKSVKVAKRFPSAIMVEYEEYQVATRMMQDYNDPVYLVGRNGGIVATVNPNDKGYDDIPLIQVPTTFIEITHGPKIVGTESISQKEFQARIDIEVKGEDRTRQQGIDSIEIGVAVDDLLIQEIAPEVQVVPEQKRVGQIVASKGDVQKILDLKEQIEINIPFQIREIWYYDIEREVHVEIAAGVRTKFSLEYPLEKQIESLSLAINGRDISDWTGVAFDLRIPGKVFSCESNSCL